jgi:hypothetical protein
LKKQTKQLKKAADDEKQEVQKLAKRNLLADYVDEEKENVSLQSK